MQTKFEQCLERGKIISFSRGKKLARKELKSALEDLKSAEKSLGLENYKWSTIQSYYSMFHSARALLYAKNYREKSHFCLIEAIRTLYLEKGLLNYTLIEALQRAKMLREEADYYGEFTQENAKYLITKAKEFIEKVNEILTKNNL